MNVITRPDIERGGSESSCSFSPRPRVPRETLADDLGKTDPHGLIDAVLNLFLNGLWTELTPILSDGHWYRFVTSLKGSAAQKIIDVLQHVRYFV